MVDPVGGDVRQGGGAGCLPTGVNRAIGTFSDDVMFQKVWEEMFGTSGAWISALYDAILAGGGTLTAEEILGLQPSEAHTKFAVDENCRLMRVADDARSCGAVNIGYYVSPLSLDLGGEGTWTAVRFNLSPKQRNPWVVWKASEKRPLLVHDPDHTGKVTDGRQLFGNWTFGGRASVRLASLSSPPAVVDEWSNGYEALAQLDVDKDGLIRGQELRPLALWYDRNQNAISEPGEVVPLQSQGITSLRTTYDTVDPLSGTLLSRNGYERRNKNGTQIVGDTLDWYSDSYPNYFAALAELDRAPRGTQREGSSSNQKEAFKSSVKLDPLGPLDGFWMWHHDSDPAIEGVFFLEEDKGRVAGVSIVERRQKPNAQGVRSFYDKALLVGSISTEGASRTITMTSNYNGVVTRSTAILDKEKGLLTGTSTGSKGGPGLKMGWTARRVVPGSLQMLKK